MYHKHYLHVVRLELTLAGLHAIKPLVINVSIACTSTVLIPSTARSTAAGSAGSAERATLWTGHRIPDGWGDGCRAD